MDVLAYEFMQRALVAALARRARGARDRHLPRAAPAGAHGRRHRPRRADRGGARLPLGHRPRAHGGRRRRRGRGAIEWCASAGGTSGDVALALLFYGGIAGGVLLIGLSPGGSSATLLAYLFGSLSGVARRRPRRHRLARRWRCWRSSRCLGRVLFAVSQDEEVARVAGCPCSALNLLLAVMAAVTVTVAMRVVGLLLVWALMVVPVATAQQLTALVPQHAAAACGLGAVASVGGAGARLLRRRRPRAAPSCSRSSPSRRAVAALAAVDRAIGCVGARRRRTRAAVPRSGPGGGATVRRGPSGEVDPAARPRSRRRCSDEEQHDGSAAAQDLRRAAGARRRGRR